jgi:plasmid rolling circle replication initiator protein Rep
MTMSAPLSPVAEFVRTLQLKRESTLAAARTFQLLAECLPETRNVNRFEILARRLTNCMISMTWRVVTEPGQATRVRIHNKRDCRSRFCSVSAGWMAKRQGKRINAIIDEIHVEYPDARALFLTLTLPTQSLQRASVKPLQTALARFWKMQQVREHSLGHFEAIECKVTESRTLHIHAHCLVYVRGGPDGYFANDVPRIHQRVWASWWQQASRLDRRPVVDIRACRGRDGSTDRAAVRAAVREAAKYAISSAGLYQKTDKGIVVDPAVALALYNALRGKHLVKFDRCFKDAEKRLKQRARTQSATDAFGT